MKITCETVDGVTVVRIEESALDAETAPGFRRVMAVHLRGGGRVLLDLGALRFMDSTGIGAVLACLRLAAAADGTLKLCSPAEPLRAAFGIVRLDRLLDIFATRDEALAAFRAAATT